MQTRKEIEQDIYSRHFVVGANQIARLIRQSQIAASGNDTIWCATFRAEARIEAYRLCHTAFGIDPSLREV